MPSSRLNVVKTSISSLFISCFFSEIVIEAFSHIIINQKYPKTFSLEMLSRKKFLLKDIQREKYPVRITLEAYYNEDLFQ